MNTNTTTVSFIYCFTFPRHLVTAGGINDINGEVSKLAAEIGSQIVPA